MFQTPARFAHARGRAHDLGQRYTLRAFHHPEHFADEERSAASGGLIGRSGGPIVLRSQQDQGRDLCDSES